MVLTWVDCWYKGGSDEALIDTEVFVANAKKFGAYRATDPNVSIVTAAGKSWASNCRTALDDLYTLMCPDMSARAGWADLRCLRMLGARKRPVV